MSNKYELVYVILYWCENCPWVDIRGPLDVPGPPLAVSTNTPCVHCSHVVSLQGYTFPRILADRLNHLAAFGPKRRGL